MIQINLLNKIEPPSGAPLPSLQPKTEQVIPVRHTLRDAKAALPILKDFICDSQLRTMWGFACRSEERDYYRNLICEKARLIQSMPVTYEQDGKGDEAIIYLHYFRGNQDVYIVEKDKLQEQRQAYGFTNIGYGPELGYVSIIELIGYGFEFDLHYRPRPIGSEPKVRG